MAGYPGGQHFLKNTFEGTGHPDTRALSNREHSCNLVRRMVIPTLRRFSKLRLVLVVCMAVLVIIKVTAPDLFSKKGEALAPRQRNEHDFVEKRTRVHPYSSFNALLRNTVTVQSALYPESKLKHGIILVRTNIPEIDEQFNLFLHPTEIDEYAMAELLSNRINHPALTSRLVKEFSRGGRCHAQDEHSKPLVYDLGGNVGYMAFLFATLRARVVSVEPTALHGSLFALSKSLNPKLSHMITIERCALTSELPHHREQYICMELPDPRNAGFTRVATGVKTHCKEELRAPLKTLESLMAIHGDAPCAVKVDVEGFELKALEGGATVLKRHPPKVFVVEYNSYTAGDVEPLMLAESTVAFFHDTLAQNYVMEDIALSGHVFRTRSEMVNYLKTTGPPYAREQRWNTDLIFYLDE